MLSKLQTMDFPVSTGKDAIENHKNVHRDLVKSRSLTFPFKFNTLFSMLSKQLRWRNFNKYFLYQRTWLIFLFYFGEIPLRHERARIAWPPIMKMKFKCISFSPSPLYLCFFGGIFLVRTGFV